MIKMGEIKMMYVFLKATFITFLNIEGFGGC